MQTRLLSCLAGGLLGVAIASPMGDLLGLTTTLALVGCLILGVALGYVVSILIHVFTAPTSDILGSGTPHARTAARQRRPE